eukprot:gene30352-34260_t
MTTAAAPRPHIFTLAWPLLIELFLAVLAGVVGTAMAARLSDTYGAAFAIANNISVTLFLLFRIVGSGIGVGIPQNLGGGRRAIANKVALAMPGGHTRLGVVAALRLNNPRGLAWNTAGLVLSTLYLAWGVGAQQHATQVARASLQQEGIAASGLLV